MKMTILHTETLKRWGGQQNRVLLESIGLQKRGHHVIIACHRGSMLAEKSRDAGIKTYEVNMVKQAHLSTIPGLVSIIKKENIDIVSTHSSVDSWAGGLAAKLSGRRLVRFRHNLYVIGRDPLTKFIYSIPDRIVVISNAVRDVLINCGVRQDRMATITSAVDAGRFDPAVDDIRSELNIPENSAVIGNTSTFTPVKGPEYLLKAFNMIHDRVPCFLLFAGDTDERSKARFLSLVREDLRGKVFFLGHRQDVSNVLKTVDVFVYPSYLEGLGTALLEAMTMGRPVAVSDIPTFKEFVKDGENGLYFKVKDPEDIAAKVVVLLKDRELRQQLGDNAKSTALEKFGIEKMTDLTENLYREVLDSAL